MRSIRLMDKDLAEKIAAGEVVERPGSIVKEMCENSIDAGSTAITVEIKNGGIDMIRIVDNGCGIPADEVQLAFYRHSTSKMYSLEELENIAYLGFRGEALASIAAVSKVKMVTRTKDSDVGSILSISGGEELDFYPIGCPCGTGITVEELFFNTPARRKFLKKPSAEAAYIADIVSRLILAYPSISFKFRQDGRDVLHSPGNGVLKDAIMSVYGREVAESMLTVDHKVEGIRIYGMIGNSQLEKNNKSYQSLFINGRYVKDKIISAAVLNGYVNNITVGKFPMYVLYLRMDSDMVDVNVHPNKMEVRFADERKVYNAVSEAVASVLSVKNEIPSLLQPEAEAANEPATKELEPLLNVFKYSDERINIKDATVIPRAKTVEMAKKQDDVRPEHVEYADKDTAKACTEALGGGFEHIKGSVVVAESVGAPYAYATENASAFANAKPYKDMDPFVKKQDKGSSNEDIGEQISFAEAVKEQGATQAQGYDFLTDYSLIGQIFSTYIVIQSEDNVYIIDQHAAHERLLYERLVASVEAGQPIKQSLLVPQILSVSYEEKIQISSIITELEALGFDIEEFGDNGYILRSVPLLMGRPCGVELIHTILADFDRLRNCRAVDLKRQTLMQTACKHAIKAGDKLEKQEIDAIMDVIKKERVPLSCPHGRPILVCLTKKELELRFKRIQS